MIENEMTVSVPLEVVKASEIEPKEVKWLWYISLPVNEAGNPDYGKMAIIISAIHKLVIKDVVSFTDRKIAGTKEVIAK